MWACHCRFKILIYFFTKESIGFYYPMHSEHTELSFILCRENHIYSMTCKHTKQYILLNVQLGPIVKKNERISFLINPNPKTNPNP